MLQLSSSVCYYWYNGFADMRKSFDALSGMVQEHMGLSVVQGGVYIFINKKRNQIKLLTWDTDGLAIYYKRLEKGVYELPVIKTDYCNNKQSASIDVVQLQLILQGIVLSSIKTKKRFSLKQKAL